MDIHSSFYISFLFVRDIIPRYTNLITIPIYQPRLPICVYWYVSYGSSFNITRHAQTPRVGVVYRNICHQSLHSCLTGGDICGGLLGCVGQCVFTYARKGVIGICQPRPHTSRLHHVHITYTPRTRRHRHG